MRKSIFLMFVLAVLSMSGIIYAEDYIDGNPSSQQAVNNLSNELASTTLGSEGIRLIGALGGSDLKTFINDTSVSGVVNDNPVFNYVSGSTNRIVSWEAFDIYDYKTGYHHVLAGTNFLEVNGNHFAYWNILTPDTLLWTTGSRANITNNIPVANFSVSVGRINHHTKAITIGDLALRMDDGHYQIFPSLIKEGLNFYPIGTNFNQIAQDAGIEVHNMNEDNSHYAKNFTTGTNFLNRYYHDSSTNWTSVRTNSVDVTKYDNGTGLVSCVVSNWYRGVFCAGAASLSAAWIYPTTAYTNYADALAADDPERPEGFDPYIPRCTAYIFQGGDTSLRQSSDSWLDRRFMIRRGTLSSGGGSSGSTPSLQQVLGVNPSSGGILITGLGTPSSSDHVANKGYVDSKYSGYSWVNDNSNKLVFTSSRFKANIGSTNIVTATGANIIKMTNNIYLVVGSYSNNLSRWYPRQTNVIVKIYGASDYTSLANGDVLQLSIYKNGTNMSDVSVATTRLGDQGANWAYTDFPESTNDYYEIWSTSTFSGSRTTIRAGSNNWWYGETILK